MNQVAPTTLYSRALGLRSELSHTVCRAWLAEVRGNGSLRRRGCLELRAPVVFVGQTRRSHPVRWKRLEMMSEG